MQATMAARLVAFVLAALAVGLRIASAYQGAFNFNPVHALGTFGGARLKSWLAYVLPLAVMFVTDVALSLIRGFDYGLGNSSRIWVYGSLLIYVAIGRTVVGDSKSPLRIGAATLLGAAQFFLITNFFEWLALPEMYSRDLSGLATSYVAALPFSINTLMADLIFTPAAFLAHAWLTREQPASIAESQSA